MTPLARWTLRALLTRALTLALPLALASCTTGGNPDVLWKIVDRCVDPRVADDCTSCLSPRVGTRCAANRGCRETTEVWAESPEFVAIRDRKMCGCPDGFVHGLVIPRQRITGVEDPKRPDGIWAFAWSEARRHLPAELTIALVVNPARARSQNQLHVHLLRLRDDARAAFAGAATAQVQDLSTVWSEASLLARARRLSDYGVLVAKDPRGGFLVVVKDTSPEHDYSVERCSPVAEVTDARTAPPAPAE